MTTSRNDYLQRKREARRRYYAANREAVLAAARGYYLRNRDRIRAQQNMRAREMTEPQRAYQRERAKQWRHRNPERAAAYSRHWRERNPERSREVQWRHNYGIDRSVYERLLTEQAGLCAICGFPERRKRKRQPMPLVVDHDHRTGQIRGLLCHGCNTGLGSFCDDPGRLLRAVRYATRHCNADRKAEGR